MMASARGTIGVLPVLLAAGLAVATAGCGGSRDDPPESPRMTVSPTPPTPDPFEPEEIGAEDEADVPARAAGADPTVGVIRAPSPIGSDVIGASSQAGGSPEAQEGDEAVASQAPPVANREEPLDPFGFNGQDYAALMTPEEIDVLRLRSRGDIRAPLTSYLTEKEKANLRRRAAESQEIAADPVGVGE